MYPKENAEYNIVDAFNGIEIVKADYQKQSFSKHVHEGYTIGVINKGAQRFYRSGSHHIASEDSIILVNADDVHTGESATEYGWQYRAIYPTPEHFAMISQDFLGSKALIPYFKDSVIHDNKLARQLRLIFEHIDHGESSLLIETLIYGTFVNLVGKHGRPIQSLQDVSISRQKLMLAKDFLDAYPSQNISLARLAEVAGCSKYHFVRQFSRFFGLSPHAYQIQARLKKAKQLLKAGVAISHVAIDCGFHDQSHLTRHFKQALGTTPKHFQNQAILYNPPTG